MWILEIMIKKEVIEICMEIMIYLAYDKIEALGNLTTRWTWEIYFFLMNVLFFPLFKKINHICNLVWRRFAALKLIKGLIF